ncbi:MAG: hypothetical protein ACI9BW_003750 [Gammaproteobacteria bacterium]|jgi:hypothetical protein
MFRQFLRAARLQCWAIVLAVNLDQPENVEFGADGFLYITKDGAGNSGRVLRVDSDGIHNANASGFDSLAGLAFDSSSGRLHISELGTASIYRLDFSPVPVPGALYLLLSSLVVGGIKRKRATVRL